ncbi:hypothetical protein HY571_02995 [Candidatus Micrarchaeota archaeon]|nr:hypothetical protein [Candidatus Micrarchaeota archaeon]
MFKMRFSYGFNRFVQNNAPLFERVKKKGESPGYLYRLSGVQSSNVNGVALGLHGLTTFTPLYAVTMYCDVCELPVREEVIHGKTREIGIGEFKELESEEFKRSLEKGDAGFICVVEKFVDLKKSFKSQCSTCGRWTAQEHSQCFDQNLGLCAYCADVLKKFGEYK